MFRKKIDLFFVFLISIISLFLVFDIFVNKGQPATFDGTTHITTIAQFYKGMSEGEVRVTWGDGFANYGMPIPLISQQLTPNLASVINFLFSDVLISFNIVFLIGALLSGIFYYIFLRIYFTPQVAFAGAFLFNFAPYRIINIYIRGAQPEFFAGVFIPLILISIFLICKRKNPYGVVFLVISVTLLILTHPFMFIISSTIFAPYVIYCLYDEKQKLKLIIKIISSIALGIGITAYYTLPLFLEVKYFYYGLSKDHFVPNQFLELSNYFDPNWYYYFKNDVFVRGNFIKAGLLETTIILAGLGSLIFSVLKRKKEPLLIFSLLTSVIIIFLTTYPSNFLYQKITFLNGIQHPWRILGSYIFVTPIILCLLISKIKYQKFAAVAIILLISIIRFPQLYGKNYTLVPQANYFKTTENLHGNILNTVWTGKTSEYPVKKEKPEIISGDGKIRTKIVKNSTRKYEIDALTNLRMADYTFYFPGWKAYIDGKETPIQFQDPNYRGVITYDVPKGSHTVDIKFENTKPRILGYAISLSFLFLCIAYLLFIKGNLKFFYSAIPKAWRK